MLYLEQQSSDILEMCFIFVHVIYTIILKLESTKFELCEINNGEPTNELN